MTPQCTDCLGYHGQAKPCPAFGTTEDAAATGVTIAQWQDVCYRHNTLFLENKSLRTRLAEVEAREKAKDERIRELEGVLGEAEKWIDVRAKFANSFIDTDYARQLLALGDSIRALSTPSPSQPVKVAEGEACECGHHENDHEGSFDMKRAYCGGGLSESCSCRSWRPVTPSKESHNG